MKHLTTCILECPDVCSLLVERRADGSIKIRGNPDHPFTRGFTCAKIHRLIDRLRSPERILQPLFKAGGRWQAVSWETALDMCAEHLQACRRQPASILHIAGDGARGVLQLVPNLFFDLLGSSRIAGSLCDNAGIEACIEDFGSLSTNDITDLLNARTIVNWGRDLTRTSVHVTALVKQARKQGTRVVTISPGGDGNQSLSDQVLRIRPGTDRFLAAAVLRLLVERNRVLPDVVALLANWTAFRERIEQCSIEDLAGSCDVSRAEIEQLYDCYARSGPVSTLIGWGLQRHRFGGENVRFINALAMLSGNVGRAGAGAYFNISSMRNFDRSWAAVDHLEPRRTFLLPLIGREILRAENPPVKMIWVNGSNVVNQAPDSRRIAEAFSRVPFKVVVDAFLTDTAQRADLVLPCALMLERDDVTGSYLHDYVGYARKILEPPDGVRSDWQILSDLGRRLDPPVLIPDRDACFRASLNSSYLGVSLEELRTIGFTRAKRPSIAYEGVRFDHPDGKYRLPQELHREPPPPEGFPLRLLTLIRKDATHSQILTAAQSIPPSVWVAPDCPALPSLRMDREVFLVSPLGRIQVEVKIASGLHPDVVIYRRGDWMHCGGGANQLIAAQPTDLGGGTAFYSQYVRLQN